MYGKRLKRMISIECDTISLTFSSSSGVQNKTLER